MKATWEKIEKNVGVLQVEVDADKVASALDKAFKKIVGRVNVPGFRKGKVPRALFEKKFGVESLYQDALDILLPEAYVQAVEQTGITPVDRPDVDVEKFAKGEPMIFKATVTVKPEVQLGEYKGLEVEVQDVQVADEEIDAELKRLQERHAELVIVDEGVAENGDIVVIDFEGFVDGEAFEGGKAEKYSLELGSGSFIPGFEDQVVGMSKDEEKDVNVTFPEDYQADNLKGKPAVFKVKLHDIKRKSLPELDDEFAKDVSEFDTLDEYKEDLKKKLQENKEKEAQAKKEADVVAKAAENAELEVPAAMVETELNAMIKDFERRILAQGLTLEMYYQFTGQNEGVLRDQMREDAGKRVRNNLVLEAIAAAENIEASDEDVEKEIERVAEQFGKSVEEVRSIFEANGTIADMKEELKLKLTVDFLVDNMKSA